MTDKSKNPNRSRIDARAAARDAAKANGEKIFHTGEPCPEGHLSGYKVICGSCYQCSLDRAKLWKAKNRQKCVAHSMKSAKKRRAAVKKYQAEWRQKNRERLIEQRKEYLKTKHEQVKESQRRSYHKNKEYYRVWGATYRKEKADLIRERRKRQKLENPEKFRSWDRAKLARRRSAPGIHTADDIASIMKMQKHKCAYCKIKLGENYHVDHITPLSRGGTNDRRNLQILCQPCNQAKHCKLPEQFAREIGRLI